MRRTEKWTPWTYGSTLAILALLAAMTAACGSDEEETGAGGNTGTGGTTTVDNTPTVTEVIPAMGNRLGGEAVTVRGTKFVDGSVVRFGALEVAATYLDDTTLEVVTPESAAGTVDVTVRTPEGDEGALPASFEFIGVTLTFVHQNGFRFDDGNAVVYMDAFHALYSNGATDADLILISHDMNDHFLASAVRDAAQASGATVVGPEPVISALQGFGLDGQLVVIEGIAYGEKISGTYAGVTVDTYFTQHIGEAQDYHHMSFRLELGGMVLFLPGDMTGSNWTGPLAGYTELLGMDVAMGSAGFVNLSTLAQQNPAVIIEVHNQGSCEVFTAYPDVSFTLNSGDSFSIPIAP